MFVTKKRRNGFGGKNSCFYAPDTRFRNERRAATKLRETTQNMGFGPKVVDWAYSLRKNEEMVPLAKTRAFMHPDTRFRNG